MAASNRRRPGSLRIIGGLWRGRRVEVPDRPGLRPTPDRVRETLFNWLQASVVGARCLDLFAGSGALAIEALSRGASAVVAVEHDAEAVASLRRAAFRLGATSLEVVHADALAYLAGPPRPFDIVFLDPPFDGDLLGRVVPMLEPQWLEGAARIYLECAPGQEETPLPGTWEILRRKRAGEVVYRLAGRA